MRKLNIVLSDDESNNTSSEDSFSDITISLRHLTKPTMLTTQTTKKTSAVQPRDTVLSASNQDSRLTALSAVDQVTVADPTVGSQLCETAVDATTNDVSLDSSDTGDDSDDEIRLNFAKKPALNAAVAKLSPIQPSAAVTSRRSALRISIGDDSTDDDDDCKDVVNDSTAPAAINGEISQSPLQQTQTGDALPEATTNDTATTRATNASRSADEVDTPEPVVVVNNAADNAPAMLASAVAVINTSEDDSFVRHERQCNDDDADATIPSTRPNDGDDDDDDDDVALREHFARAVVDDDDISQRFAALEAAALVAVVAQVQMLTPSVTTTQNDVACGAVCAAVDTPADSEKHDDVPVMSAPTLSAIEQQRQPARSQYASPAPSLLPPPTAISVLVSNLQLLLRVLDRSMPLQMRAQSRSSPVAASITTTTTTTTTTSQSIAAATTSAPAPATATMATTTVTTAVAASASNSVQGRMAAHAERTGARS
jgi:hypothetical protein